MDLLFTRNQEDTIFRAVSLCLVSAVAEWRLIKRELTVDNIKELLTKFNIQNDITKKEEIFLMNANSTKEECEKYIWKYEAVLPLLWALGFIKELDKPTNICDTWLVTGLILGKWVDVFTENAKLRTIDEIHWEYQNYLGYLNDNSLNLDVVKERLHALAWLTAKDNLAWDELEDTF